MRIPRAGRIGRPIPPGAIAGFMNVGEIRGDTSGTDPFPLGPFPLTPFPAYDRSFTTRAFSMKSSYATT